MIRNHLEFGFFPPTAFVKLSWLPILVDWFALIMKSAVKGFWQ